MSLQLFSLAGKAALVTGAGSGLGQAIAIGVARAGAAVLCADISGQAAEATAAAIRAQGGRAHAAQADVTDQTQVQSMVRQALESLGGRIDISYHMAGVNRARKPALDLSLEDMSRVYDVNVGGLLACCQAVGQVMLQQGKGSVVNAASIMSRVAAKNNLAYASSKGAVATITQTLALEWADRGVRVNALAPGFMKTPLVSQILADAQWTARIEGRTPMGRLGDPEEIVGPAIFLGSDASSYITGTLLFVDGGWTAM